MALFDWIAEEIIVIAWKIFIILHFKIVGDKVSILPTVYIILSINKFSFRSR